MADAVVVFAGTFVIAGAGYILAARWITRPRPVKDRDGRWRAAPRGRGLRR